MILLPRSNFIACALFVVFSQSFVAREAVAEDTQYRPQAWYLHKVQVAGIQFPFDYVGLFVTVTSGLILYYGLFGGGKPKPMCTASHILIDKHDDATLAKMEAFKKSLGNDKEAFAKCAKENSTCPSKNSGGMLGTFPKGAMVPAFDKCCFDPSTPLHTTVGPVHTHFGYHLILIHDRKLPKE
jgi:peptidyl-prolyl cis-trans isomerase C